MGVLGDQWAEIERLQGLNNAANRIIAEQAQTIAKMHAALLASEEFHNPNAAAMRRAALALVEQRK